MIVDKIKKREVKNIRPNNKVDIPIGKWIKCEACKEILYKENIKENNSVCPLCGHSFRMSSRRRIEQVIDEETFEEFRLNIDTVNPLQLEDYEHKISVLREKTKLEEAVKCGVGEINSQKTVICVMDSNFLM